MLLRGRAVELLSGVLGENSKKFRLSRAVFVYQVIFRGRAVELQGVLGGNSKKFRLSRKVVVCLSPTHSDIYIGRGICGTQFAG